MVSNIGSETVNYRKVFTLPKKEWPVLLSQDNVWGFEYQGKFRPFVTPQDCMPLLPLLEFSYPEVLELIRKGINDNGIDRELIESFPLWQVIQRALTWETSYWPSLAVQWLEKGYPLLPEFTEALIKLSEEKHFSQQLRHKAQHLVERYGDFVKE